MWRVVSKHLQEQPGHHAGDQIFVMAQESNGSDGLGHDEEAVREIWPWPGQQRLDCVDPDDHPREIVIDHGWVAKVSGENETFIRFTRDHNFTDLKHAGLKAGSNLHPILVLIQLFA